MMKNTPNYSVQALIKAVEDCSKRAESSYAMLSSIEACDNDSEVWQTLLDDAYNWGGMSNDWAKELEKKRAS
jgi:hypothetical protein